MDQPSKPNHFNNLTRSSSNSSVNKQRPPSLRSTTSGFPLNGPVPERLERLYHPLITPSPPTTTDKFPDQENGTSDQNEAGLFPVNNSARLEDIEGRTLSGSRDLHKSNPSNKAISANGDFSPSSEEEDTSNNNANDHGNPNSSTRKILGGSRALTRSRLKKAVWGARIANTSWRQGGSKTAVLEQGNFPLLASALAIPAYHFHFDHGHQPPAIILEAFKLAITDSHVQDNDMGEKHDVFRIELEYGPIKWVVYRKLYDFYRLHYYIKKRYLIGKIRSYPRLPNQLYYAFHRAKSFSSGDVSNLALQRRKDLEGYLVQAIKMLSMQMHRELLEFLEVGGSSIRKYMGWKGREGYLSLRTSKTNELGGCFPAIFGRWNTCWVMVRDSYVIICQTVYDTKPYDVLLFNRFTKLNEAYLKSSNPLNDHKIGLLDHRRRIDLRVESKSDKTQWLSHLRSSIKESQFTKEHRFNSFAPIRSDIRAKWYIDGAGYFYDVSEAILNAKDTIYIADWWLSPELYLRRPPADFPEFRLDRLLRQKAEQGVEIYVLVYKEVAVSLPNNSQHTKRALKKLHRNIKVQRHPDHVQANGTWFWAHHEKLIVVDNRMAFLGGLDLCFGRFDDNSHRLADYNPLSEDGRDIMFPGQDYANARIRDNYDVHQHDKEIIDRKSYARMPWHDISVSVVGTAARDAARHFIERWNFIKSSKAKQRPHIPFLLPQGDKAPERDSLDGDKGTCKVQVLRSSAEWSSGVEKENSIYSAYVDSINRAQFFIYIENQFFVTAAKGDPSYTVKNQIARALVDRIKRAHEEGAGFRVIVVMPLMPAFQSELHESGANTIRMVMQWQYQSICRGKESVMGQLKELGIEPDDYIFFHGLRNYDLIPQSHKHQPETELPENTPSPEKPSLIHRPNSSSAGEFDLGCQDPESLYHHHKRNRFSLKQSRDSIKGMLRSLGVVHDIGDEEDRSSDEEGGEGTNENEDNNHHKNTNSISQPKEAKLRNTNNSNTDNLQTGGAAPQKVVNQPLAPENTDAASQYVTEQVYIHSKLMIVDDRLVICGSANINDRSMLGYRDSEIAVIIEDEDLISSQMNQEKFMVGRFAHTLRTTLFKEHLGLLQGTEMVNLINWEASENPGDAPVTQPDLETPDPPTSLHSTEVLADPLAPHFTKYWRNVANYNTRAFREVFRVVPDDTITNWDQYKDFIPSSDRVVTGHPDFRNLRPSQIMRILSKVRGHLVEFPTKFLEEENFSISAFSAESMIPVDVFI